MSDRRRFAVVGKGLIGSAAARHLAEAGQDVVLIGPDESTEVQGHGGVFASHHDAGRITRVLDRDPLWATLARDSLAGHPALEATTGIRFHHPHAVRFVAGVGSDLPAALTATAAQLGVACRHDAPIHADLALPAGAVVLGEEEPAGWIAPRQLVRAQVLAAIAAGARIVRQPVWALRERADGVHLILDDGSEVIADRVLLCAGVFTAPVELATGLPLTSEGRTVLRARVEPDQLERLAGLPCLVLDASGFDPADLYLMPPLRYPDGHHYVKLGTSAWTHVLDDLEQLQQWFRLPPPGTDSARLADALVRLLPILADAVLEFDTCAVTRTTTGRPLVDWTTAGRIAVACGGNGKAAKSSDAIGRLAALLVSDAPTPVELEALRLP